MLSTNIFYSGYNTLFSILSLFIGIGSVFLIKDSKDFKSLFTFQLGSLFLIFTTYIITNEPLLYKIGLNYNYVTFVEMFISLITSALWINSACELYNNKPANREFLTLYISICLSICAYYSFIWHNQTLANSFSAIITIAGITLLLLSSVIKLYNNTNIGNTLLTISLFMLWGKLFVSAYLFKYNWLNLNLFNWLWIYVFTASIIFIKISILNFELQKSWNNIDKLNLQMNNMIDSSPFPIIISKITGDKLLFINNKASAIFGISKKETGYHKLKDFLVDENNRTQFFTNLEKKHEVQDFDLMVCNIINASPFWLSVSAKTIEYNNEMAIYMAFQDITLRKQRETNLQNQADKDPLTLAWNRRYFEKIIPKYIKECIKKSQQFSLLMLDADKFKNINDTYGHKQGDKVLISLAETCRKSLRENDIVCRFGGEEFIVFLNNADSVAALSVAERLRQNIAESFIENDEGKKISFTVSIDIVSSEKTASLDVLLRQVDDAMYLAKNNGRNRVELYNEEAIKNIINKKTNSSKRNLHPVFQNEETEEISLLDNYDNKIL